MGGYQLINFADVNLVSGTGKVIKGIYETIKGNYRKPTVIHKLTIDNIEQTDVYAQFVVSGSDYKATISQGTITVTNNDTVTFTSVSSTSSTSGNSGVHF